MSRQTATRVGRPAKTGSPAFRLLTLSWFSRPLSQEAIAGRVAKDLGRGISQPTVGSWLRKGLPRIATPTIALKRPEEAGVRCVCLLFQRRPARAVALYRLLRREPLVSRVEHLRGDFSVMAEVTAVDGREIDAVVERFDPDVICEVVECRDAARAVLRRLGRQLAREGL